MQKWNQYRMFLAVCAAAALPLTAQQTNVPLNGPAPGLPAAAQKVFDAQHLKDRPYTGSLPKPQYPSSERVQRAFTVAYVYDYAYAAYTPAVELPVVAKSLVKRDTPENAAIAFFSAQRTGDWESFLQCWADADRKRIQAMVTGKQLDQPALLAKWKQFYTNKTVQLMDRIETTGYVILDLKIPGPGGGDLPAVFKLVEGQWMVTNELGMTSNQMLSDFRPDLAGIVRSVQPASVQELAGGQKQNAAAQREFLEEHNRRNEVIQAAR